MALAQGPPPLGEEFQVNTYTPSWQAYPAIAGDPAGNFVVVWASYAQDGSLPGIFGQRYDAEGHLLGEEFQVNTYTQGVQVQHSVARDAGGKFVVVWSSREQDGSNYGVFGQRFDANGRPLGGEFQVNTYTTGTQSSPDVAADATGNFVVVWQGQESQAGAGTDILGQRYAAEGQPIGPQFQVNTHHMNVQVDPQVAVHGSGDFVVVWASYGQDGSNWGIFGQRFDAGGSSLGEEFQVNTYTTGFQISSDIAADAGGNLMVVWQRAPVGPGGCFDDNTNIFAQRYDASGNPSGTEFQVNTFTPFAQCSPALAADAAGNFVVVWSSYYQDGSQFGVFGQRYDATGSRMGGEWQVNTQTSGYQRFAAVAARPTGDFVVAWSSYPQDGSLDGVFGQRYWGALIFTDDFESGDTAAWDETVP